jgi:hypothetical protein
VTQPDIHSDALLDQVGEDAAGVWELKMWAENGGQLDWTHSAGYFDGVRLVLEDTNQLVNARREFVPGAPATVAAQIIKFDATNSGVDPDTIDPLYPSGDMYHQSMNGAAPLVINGLGGSDWFNTSTYHIDVPTSTAVGASFLIDYVPQFYCRPPHTFTVKVTICESPPTPGLPVLLGVTANGGSFKWNPNFNPPTATYESKISVQQGSGCVVLCAALTSFVLHPLCTRVPSPLPLFRSPPPPRAALYARTSQMKTVDPDLRLRAPNARRNELSRAPRHRRARARNGVQDTGTELLPNGWLLRPRPLGSERDAHVHDVRTPMRGVRQGHADLLRVRRCRAGSACDRYRYEDVLRRGAEVQLTCRPIRKIRVRVYHAVRLHV